MTPPPFFAEACGYRGSARYVALRWTEEPAHLLLSDNGHVKRGRPAPMVTLWRRDGGEAALAHLRQEISANESPQWLLLDREEHRISVGCALSVWRVIDTQHAR